MRLYNHVTVFLTACLFLQTAQAMFEDQAGVNDWHRLNIGVPITIRPHGSKLFVSTESGVLACMKGSDGSLLWRKQLRNQDQRIGAIEVSQQYLYTLTENGKGLRKWNTASGALLWSKSLHSQETDETIQMPTAIIVDAEEVFALGAGQLTLLIEGNTKWNVNLSNSVETDSPISFTRLIMSDHNLIVGGQFVDASSNEQKVVMMSVSRGSGSVSNVHTFGDVAASSQLVSLDLQESPSAVQFGWLASSGKEINLASPDGARSQITLPKQFDALKSTTAATEKSTTFSLSSNGEEDLFQVANAQVAQVAEKSFLPGTQFRTEHITGDDSMLTVAVSRSEGSWVVSLPSKGLSMPVQAQVDQDARALSSGTLESFSAQVAVDDAGVATVRVVLVLDDGAVVSGQGTMVTNAVMNALWSREESLATIVKTVWVEEPVKVNADAAATVDKTLLLLEEGSNLEVIAMRWLDQVDSLKSSMVNLLQQVQHNSLAWTNHVVTWLLSGASGALGSPSGSVSSYSEHEKAFFGFKKIIVVLTAKSTVFGLESDTGKVLWKASVPPTATSTKFQVTRLREIGTHAPEVLLVSSFPDNTIEATWLNAVSGKTVRTETARSSGGIIVGTTLAQQLAADSTVSSAEAIHSHHTAAPYVAIDAGLELLVLPAESTKLVCEKLIQRAAADGAGLVLFFVDKEARQVTGFGVRADLEAGGACHLEASVRWSHALPRSSAVEAFAGLDPADPVDTGAVALGDGTVLVKYVNPHLFAVASSREAGGLVVQLIDAWTGAVVHRVSHASGSGPVEMMLVENAVVYSYWNSKAKRTEVSSIVLTEQTFGKWDLNPWSSSGLNSTMDVANPVVLQKTFSINAGVLGLHATTSRHGITAKKLLVVLRAGRVLSLDRRFLDPLRPEASGKKLSAEQQKLQLMQYFPELPVAPAWLLTYNLSLSLDDVMSMPTKLESTALVFSHGLDLFYTRTAPSQPFDLLAEDFNYVLLVALTAGLTVAVIVMRQMVKRQQLFQQWA